MFGRFKIQRLLSGLLPLLLLMLAGCSEPPQQLKEVIRPVKLLEVTSQNLQQLREFPAKVQASQEAQISFRMPGQLVAFAIQPSQQVSKGQTLARLDDRDIKNELAVRQANFDLAKTEFARIQELTQKKLVPQSAFDNASATLKSAKAALSLAKDRLTYSEIKAPFSGRVAQTLVENYQFVQAQQTILVLQSDKTLDISIQLPQNILSNIRQKDVDQSYQPSVSFGEHKKNYLVRYKEHSTQITPGTQSFEIIFSMPIPKDLTIYPGMGATLHMDLAKIMPTTQQQTGFTIPLSAVLKDDANTQYQVWKFDPQSGEVTPVTVTVGKISQSGILITSGIEAGNQLVAAGLNRLQPGMIVKPLSRERGL